VYLFQISFAGILFKIFPSLFMIDAVRPFRLYQGLIMPSIVIIFAFVLILINREAN